MFFWNPPTSLKANRDSSQWYDRVGSWISDTTELALGSTTSYLFSPTIPIRIRHEILQNSGFHRQYQSHFDFSSTANEDDPYCEADRFDLGTCSLQMEWLFPQDIIVDQWMLHRLTSGTDLQWDFGSQLVDLEASAYDLKAKPFTLRAVSQLRSNQKSLTVTIPDILIRYQKPSNLASMASLQLSPPTCHLQCQTSVQTKIISDPQAATIRLEVPVAFHNPAVNQITFAVVLTSTVYLLSLLFLKSP